MFKNEAFPENHQYSMEPIPQVIPYCRDSVWVTTSREHIRVRNLKDSHLTNLVTFLAHYIGKPIVGPIGDVDFFRVILEECSLRGLKPADIAQGQKPYITSDGDRVMWDFTGNKYVYVNERGERMNYPTLSKWSTLSIKSAEKITPEQVVQFNTSVSELCLYNHEWSIFYNKVGEVSPNWSCKSTSIEELLQEMRKLAKRHSFFCFVADILSDQYIDEEQSESYEKRIGQFFIQNGTVRFETY